MVKRQSAAAAPATILRRTTIAVAPATAAAYQQNLRHGKPAVVDGDGPVSATSSAAATAPAEATAATATANQHGARDSERCTAIHGETAGTSGRPCRPC